MTDDSARERLDTEHNRAKRGEGLPKEGPPVSQMATTFGSSFVGSEEEAEEIAREASVEEDEEAEQRGS